MRSASAPGTRPAVKVQSLRERQRALVLLCVGVFMVVLDGSVVNVALPSIQDDLGFSQPDLAWVVNAYVIAFGGLLLLAGRLGDVLGHARVFVGGLALFTAASLACGLAQGQEMLVAARFVQGIGGALTAGVVLAMIVTMFPKPREQAKGISVYAFVAASGGAVGLLVGGVLTEALSWHWVFFVNLPFGVVALALARRMLRFERTGKEREADVPGGVAITAAMMLLVYAILQTAEHDWASTRTLALLALTAALLGLFVVRELRAPSPLVPLGIFRLRDVSGANAVQFLMVAGLTGMFFLGALYLQNVLGYRVVEVGLAFLPLALALAFVSLRVSPRLLRKRDPRTVLLAGLALVGAALALFARVPVGGEYAVDVLPALVLLGSGAGLCFPSVTTIALSVATQRDAGLLSGIVNTTQQVGGALGLAVLAAVSTTRTEDLLAQGEPPPAAVTEGYNLAFWIATGVVGVAIALTLAVIQSTSRRTAPKGLDPIRVEGEREDDPRGATDPDFVALGLGATNMMAMLWSIAMGRRAVGVEMRGDPVFGLMQWNVREDLYHHLALIDRLMLERYGEDRLPRLGDGRLFRLSECFYNPDGPAGDATADEVVSGFDRESHIGGRIDHVEFIDDRWRDGRPVREVTLLGPPTPPAEPDTLAVLSRPMQEVLGSPSTFQCPAAELLILLRRYLEALERQDLERGLMPRVRLFTSHRVVTSSGRGWRRALRNLLRREEGFVDAAGGAKRILIEPVRELDHKGKLRRVRVPGASPIDLGVPELFVVAQGVGSDDARRLGLVQREVMLDHGDGRGPVPARADYVVGLYEILVDARVRRRIASEFDSEGNEYWVRQIAIGHEDDAEVGWVMVEVPDFKAFDPIAAGLAPRWASTDSAKYFAGYQYLLRDWFFEQSGLLLDMTKEEMRRVQIDYGPKLYSFVERIGDDALVAANGVVAGDSFGNGHYLSSGGAMTGMLGHAARVLRYWLARDLDTPAPVAIRALADGIKDDTEAWLGASADEFRQPPLRDPDTRSEGGRVAELAERFEALEEIRRHRESLLPLDHAEDHADEWTRLVVHTGMLYGFGLPPIKHEHPALRGQATTAPPPVADGDGAALSAPGD